MNKGMLLFPILLLLASPVLAYEIVGDSVVYDSATANMTVTPHTASSPTGVYEQEFKVCSKAGVSAYLWVGYGFEQELTSGNLYLKQYSDENVTVFDYCENTYYPNSSYEGTNCYYTNETITTSNYVDKTSYVNTNIYQGKNFYYTTQGLLVEPNECVEWRVNYEPYGNNGKWDLWLWADQINDWRCVLDDSCAVIHTLDPWYNNSWNERTGITVTVDDGSTLTNHQVLFNVTNVSAQPDFRDLRFVSNDNSTEFCCWNRTVDVGNYAEILCNVDTINSTVWMYSNNSEVSSNWDGKCTFPELFDDFDDGSINTTIWTWSTLVIENGSLIHVAGSGVPSYLISNAGFNMSDGKVLEAKIIIPDYSQQVMFEVVNNTNPALTPIIAQYITDFPNADQLNTRTYISGDASQAQGTPFTPNESVILGIDRLNSSRTDFYMNGTRLNISYEASGDTGLIAMYAIATADMYADWIYLRESSAVEPVVSFGSEETFFTTNITSCVTISDYGEYDLTQNISSAATCLTIASDNVTINGNGYTATYAGLNNKGVVSDGYENITINNLVVEQNGTDNSTAIYLLNGNNLTATNNTVTTFGNNTNSIYLITSLNSNISYNVVNVTGDDNSQGIVWLNGNNSSITNNIITTYGTSSYGIRTDELNSVTYSSNNVTTIGFNSHALAVWSYSDNVTVNSNRLITYGFQARGIYAIEPTNSNFSYNNITTFDDNAHGILLFQFTGSGFEAQNNLIEYNYLDIIDIGANSIWLRSINVYDGMYDYNTITGNVFANSDHDQLRVNNYWNNTNFKDQNVLTYDITSGLLSFENTTYGLINYTEPITASGSNLINNASSDIIIGNNTVTSNIDYSANITLYNIGDRGFNTPVMLKDGVLCGDCVNYTDLDAINVTFSVTGFSEYEVGEGDVTINLTIYSPINTTYNDVTINLNVVANDTVDTWIYQVDGNGTNNTFTPNTTFVISGEGAHSVEVWANNTFGSIDYEITYFSYDLLETINLTVYSPTNTTYQSTTSTVELNLIIDANTTINASWYEYDSNGTNVTFSPNTTITVNEGLHNLTVWANNSDGNEDGKTVYFTYEQVAAPAITGFFGISFSDVGQQVGGFLWYIIPWIIAIIIVFAIVVYPIKSYLSMLKLRK